MDLIWKCWQLVWKSLPPGPWSNILCTRVNHKWVLSFSLKKKKHTVARGFYLYFLFTNTLIRKQNGCQKLFYKYELYIANIVCKKWFLFQVEIKKKMFPKRVVYRTVSTTDWDTTNQMTIPFNNLPCYVLKYCKMQILGATM